MDTLSELAFSQEPASSGPAGTERHSSHRLQISRIEKTIPAMAAARGALNPERTKEALDSPIFGDGSGIDVSVYQVAAFGERSFHFAERAVSFGLQKSVPSFVKRAERLRFRSE